MELSLPDYVRLIESLIRLDRKNAAAKELRRLTDGEIPRELTLTFASLARKAGLAPLGVRILHPIVYPGPGKFVPATEEEKAEYAACLTEIGVGGEALDILNEVDHTKHSPAVHAEILLFKGEALGRQWHHTEAIDLLSHFLECSDLDPWQKWEGTLELVDSLLEENEFARAESLLIDAIQGPELKGFPLLYKKAVEHCLHLYAFKKTWSKAEDLIKKLSVPATRLLVPSESVIQKWKTFGWLIREPKSREALAAWQEVRIEAERNSEWDTVRRCDLIKAQALGDEASLLHLYFGTPYDRFRERLIKGFPRSVEIPDDYMWHPQETNASVPLLDLLTGRKTALGGRLKIGQVLHRLLAILASDFYGAVPIGMIHFKLYPGEQFSPVASAPRIHEAVKRLRQWFRDNDLPLTVEERSGGYRLLATAPCAIRIPHPDRLRGKSPLLVQRLQESWRDTPFSLREASEVLGVSSRSALRILSDAQKQGLIRRTGQSRAIRYHFPDGTQAD